MPELPKVPSEDDDIARLLKTVVDNFEKEDRATREWQVRRYRKLKLYWNNMSQIYWSETAQDYRTAASITPGSSADDDQNQAYYDRPVNVFQAFLQVIIAALSIQIPAILCVPDDAENPMDNITARAGNRIAERMYKQVDAVFLWLMALYVHCTEGMVACYHYVKEDENYGTYNEKVYRDRDIQAYVCPNCQKRLPDDIFDKPDAGFEEDDEAMNFAEADTIDLSDQLPVCPNCGSPLDPNMGKVDQTVNEYVGTEKKPKSRICMEIYGGLYVKISNTAKKQEDTLYLLHKYETHYAHALECYPDLRGKIDRTNRSLVGLSGLDPYEQAARLNPQYLGKFPEDNVTIRNCWLRPAAFNVLRKEDAEELKKKFPTGAKIVLVNEICAEYYECKLDDEWTLTRNPLSDFLTHEPLGELLVNIQDIVNDLISLTIQTIEHGIEQTWADPSIVNAEGQTQIEAAPGLITLTKPAAGQNISDGFFSTKPATLSPEVFTFYKIVQELAQFVTGALPSIFGGGQASNSSNTASEYAMSKGMALQRLQTPWKMFTIWWKTIFSKVIPMYMKEMKDDEKYVQRIPGSVDKFENVVIKKAELGGKIGDVELEASEQLPITDDQKRELIMELFNLNNMEVMQALIDPVNLPFIKKVTRMDEFKLPGEDYRQKQLEEIQQLLQAMPQPTPQMDANTGQQILLPSIMVDQDLDDHEIEAAVCRNWLVSEVGRETKQDNPQGYQNVLLHYKAHLEIMKANMMAKQAMLNEQMNAQNGNNNGNGNGKQPAKPPADRQVSGENNAQTPIQ